MVEQISNALGPRVPDQLLIEKPFYFSTAWIQCFGGYLNGTQTIPNVQIKKKCLCMCGVSGTRGAVV